MTTEEVEQSVERDLDENWLPLLKTDGQWDEAKIRAEMHDLVFIYHQVGEVYEYITNGKLSKPMYYADVIRAQFDDAINDAVKDAMADRQEEVGFLESRVRELEAGLASQLKHDGHTFRCFYSGTAAGGACLPDCVSARAALTGATPPPPAP